MESNRFLEIGRIINTHGVRGEVKLEPWADSPQQLKSLKTLWLEGKALPIRECRVHGRFVIAKLEGVDSVEAAMILKGKVVQADRAELPLPDGSYFIQDMIGLPVLDQNGREIGSLTEVLDYPAGRVFVVKGETEHLIPEKGGFLTSLDPALGHLEVNLLEGM
ncbi:MAG: 16S rRNA processing protein RimM [Oscillospiraceae bacterium]|nr:16S rRNA processing protein RimM [Oscillospiraceae bacterium]